MLPLCPERPHLRRHSAPQQRGRRQEERRAHAEALGRGGGRLQAGQQGHGPALAVQGGLEVRQDKVPGRAVSRVLLHDFSIHRTGEKRKYRVSTEIFFKNISRYPQYLLTIFLFACSPSS